MKRPDTEVLEIDRMVLDDKWCEFPKLYGYYLEQLAKYKTRLREKENALEYLEAKLKMAIRKRPKRFGLSKVTEPAIKECMITQEEYQQAKEGINRSKATVELLDGFCKALDAMRRAMEAMVDLHGQQFWKAEPRSRDRDLGRDMEQRHTRKRFKV